jgi:diguanylate cyclase (GGDEF)-like protein/PAS domain S-box-containing protein
MKTAKLPDNEQSRLAALQAYRLLDTPAEQVYDAITALAAQVCGTPIALVSLTDSDRQWFKSAHGLPGVREIPRDMAFCAHAILDREMLEVPDAAGDARFRDNPLVTGDPGIRFYAGVPLIDAGGHALGTLCVIDHQPRVLSATQRAALRQLSGIVVQLFEQRTSGLPHDGRAAVRQEFRNTFELAAVGMAHTTPDGRFIAVNRKLCEILGYTRDELLQMRLSELGRSNDRGRYRTQYRELREGRRSSFSGEKQWVHKDGHTVWVNRTVSSASAAGEPPTYFIHVIEDISERKHTELVLKRLSRARRVMAEANQVLVHAETEDELLQKTCDILIQSGGYCQAWVGMAEDDAQKSIRVAGIAGYEPGYLESHKGSWSGDGRFQGVMGHVIASGKRLVTQNILQEGKFSHRKQRALARGYQSSLSLPLSISGRCVGGISIYAYEADAFDEDEIKLLTQLVDDVCYGVSALRTRAAHEQASAVLRESERRTRELFNQAAVGILLSSPDLRIIDCNQKFAIMLGYAREELAGMRPADLTHPDDLGELEASRQQLLRGETEAVTVQKRYLRKDGSVIWVNRTFSLARNEVGEPLYFISVVEDITARKEIEQRFAVTFDQAAMGIAQVSLEGKYLLVNKKFCDIVGYSEEELVGSDAKRITYADDQEQVLKNRELLASGARDSIVGEKRYIRKDGRVILGKRTISLARDSTGKPLYTIRILEDITERKQIEESYRTTVRQAPVGILHSTMDLRITQVNPRLCEMLGYGEAELLQLKVSDIIYPGSFGKNRGQFEKLKSGEIPSFSLEQPFMRKDGRSLWVERMVSLVNDLSGKPSYFIQVIQDISARKETEARERATLQQAPVGIVHNSLDGRILYANPKFCEIVGYDEKELLSISNSDILHPEDRGREREGLMKQLLAGEIPSFSTEKRFVHKDGRIIWVQRTVSVVRDAAGKPLYLVRIVEDVTQRRGEEERYRTTFEYAPVGIMHTALDHRILHVNDKLCEILGYAKDEILGMSTADLLPPDYRNVDRDIYWNPMLAGRIQSHSYQRPYRRKDGSLVWTNRTVSLVRDPAGEPLYFIRMIEDISARKRAEEEASQERRMLQTLVDNLPDRVYVKNRQGRFLLQNAENVRAHGARSRDELLGKTMFDLYPREVAERIEAEDDAIFKSGVPLLNRERTTTDAAGNTHWQLSSKVPLRDEAGNIFALVGVNRDITEQKLATLSLRDSEERYHSLFDLAPMPILVFDEEKLRLVAANQAAIDKYGYTLKEFQSMSIIDLQVPEDRSDVAEQLRQRDPAKPAVFQRRHVTKHGATIIAEVTAKPFLYRGRSARIIIVNDITDRLSTEQALRQSEEQFRQLAGNIPQVFWISDATLSETFYISPACEQMLGVPSEFFRSNPRKLVKMVHPDDRAKVRNARKSAAQGRYDETYRIVRPDGSVRWIQDRAFPVHDAGGRVYRVAGIAEDITQRKEAEEKLVYLAHYDGLTGLPNRVLFRDRLEQTLAQGRRRDWLVGVLMLDLDRFKMANDTFGHAMGDMLLKQVAARLQECVRVGDTVGRFGGDEFGIILSDLRNVDDVRLVAQKFLSSFAEPFNLEANEIHVTASIGISLYPADSDDCDVLIKNADTALHRAKDSGRNNFQFYTVEMNVRVLHRLNMENKLRHALERQEFLLHYQPKASLSRGVTTGMEALLRWQHPQLGLVSPVEFVPVLEETGLIIPVGEWVIGTVCAQLKAWQDDGIKPVPVAINLSSRQFLARDLESTVSRILDQYKIDPGLLELEITESSLMINTEEAVQTLEYLNALGVNLSIDDFGTGYSSLSYLKRFPLDALKIDRSFVRDVNSDPEDAAITRAIISMAHSLGLKVVAEGVETEAQMNFLAASGCDEMQGYYLARPLPAQDCAKWLMQSQPLTRASLLSGTQVPTVLLVDDDEDALILLNRTLSQDGYRILTARNANQGFEVLSKYPVDVVISDHHMPGMMGVEFLQRVKSLYPNTVRVMSSGLADFQTVADAVNKGEIFRFVSKSIDQRQLRSDIREALGSRTAAPARQA